MLIKAIIELKLWKSVFQLLEPGLNRFIFKDHILYKTGTETGSLM